MRLVRILSILVELNVFTFQPHGLRRYAFQVRGIAETPARAPFAAFLFFLNFEPSQGRAAVCLRFAGWCNAIQLECDWHDRR
jgi:hypothetical protein